MFRDEIHEPRRWRIRHSPTSLQVFPLSLLAVSSFYEAPNRRRNPFVYESALNFVTYISHLFSHPESKSSSESNISNNISRSTSRNCRQIVLLIMPDEIRTLYCNKSFHYTHYIVLNQFKITLNIHNPLTVNISNRYRNKNQ